MSQSRELLWRTWSEVPKDRKWRYLGSCEERKGRGNGCLGYRFGYWSGENAGAGVSGTKEETVGKERNGGVRTRR